MAGAHGPPWRLAYRYFLEQLAVLPFVLGAHWFQYLDEPCFGRFDGENYACGFVDVVNRPYRDLVTAAQETHHGPYDVLTGRWAQAAKQAIPSKTGVHFG